MDPTAPKRRRLSEVPTIVYPEDRLIQSFHARNPEVSRLPPPTPVDCPAAPTACPA